MPPKEKPQKSEELNYAVEYEGIEGAKMNALCLRIKLKTLPHFIEALRCGCPGQIQDPSPYASATAAALIQTLEENMIVFKNTKNQEIEMHYGVESMASVCIKFSLPSSMSSIRQAAQILKKSITKKLEDRAYKMLVQQNKDYKGKKQDIKNSVATYLNTQQHITIYGKLPKKAENKAKIQALIDKVKASLPKKIEQDSRGVNMSEEAPKFQDHYVEMLNSQGYTDIVRMFVYAAMEQAGFDCFVGLDIKKLYVAREFCSPAHLNPLKMFIQTRLRFLTNKKKGSDKAFDKKIAQISELLHMQSAIQLDFVDSADEISSDTSIRGIKSLLEGFNDKFKN